LTDKQRQYNFSRGIEKLSLAAMQRQADRIKREKPDALGGDEIPTDAPTDIDMADASMGRERDGTPSDSEEDEGEDLMQMDEDGPLILDGRSAPKKKANKDPAEKAPRKKQAERYMSAQELRAHIRLLFVKETGLIDSLYGSHGPLHTERSKSSQADPDMFFVDVVCVPPTRYRPANVVGGIAMENPQNELLGNLLATTIRIRDRNDALKELQRKPASGATGGDKVAEGNRAYSSLLDAITDLQHNVNSLIDSSKNPTRLKGGKQNPDGIKQVLEKKEGLFRMNMMVR
jgi:DNA-directed RNA polymerase I subunit RPA1